MENIWQYEGNIILAWIMFIGNVLLEKRECDILYPAKSDEEVCGRVDTLASKGHDFGTRDFEMNWVPYVLDFVKVQIQKNRTKTTINLQICKPHVTFWVLTESTQLPFLSYEIKKQLWVA